MVETFTFSKATQQMPYVIYNGTEITDSNFIIDYFIKERNLDPTEGLSEEQQGISRAITVMLDELMGWWVMHILFTRRQSQTYSRRVLHKKVLI